MTHPLSKSDETPVTESRSEVVFDRPSLRIVRVDLPAGDEVPRELDREDAALIVVAGKGRVLIGQRLIRVTPGSVVDFAWSDAHGIVADESLRLLLVHARPSRARATPRLVV